MVHSHSGESGEVTMDCHGRGRSVTVTVKRRGNFRGIQLNDIINLGLNFDFDILMLLFN